MAPSWKDCIYNLLESVYNSSNFNELKREAENYNYVICNAITLIICSQCQIFWFSKKKN